MTVRVVTIVVDRTAPQERRPRAWIPGFTQPPVDQAGWLERRQAESDAPATASQFPSRSWLFSNQPNRSEQATWKHPSVRFEWPDGEGGTNPSVGRFLGPQPSRSEQAPWRHPPVKFDWPENEAGYSPSSARYLGPQPNRMEQVSQWRKPSIGALDGDPINGGSGLSYARFLATPPVYVEPVASWRRRPEAAESSESIAGPRASPARFLGPQPSYAERSPWRHPPPQIEPTEPFAVPPREWLAGMVNAFQPIIEHQPWRHKVEIPQTEPIVPWKSNPWGPALVAHVQPGVDHRAWKQVGREASEDAQIVPAPRFRPQLYRPGGLIPWKPRARALHVERDEPLAGRRHLILTPRDYLPWRRRFGGVEAAETSPAIPRVFMDLATVEQPTRVLGPYRLAAGRVGRPGAAAGTVQGCLAAGRVQRLGAVAGRIEGPP